MLTTQDKTKILAGIKKDPNLGLLQAVSIIAEKLKQEFVEYREAFSKQAPGIEFGKHIQSLKGDQGDAGTRGDKGEKGETGDKGPKGETGDRGLQGLIGKEGKQGPRGERGEVGAQGPKGEVGEKGNDGSPDKPLEIADKLNTTKDSVNQSVIIGLQEEFTALKKAIRDNRKGGGAKPGGGMGNVKHESKAVSSATTSVILASKISGGGFAVWAYYQGQMIVRGTHYTVGTDQKTITLTFVPQDNTFIDFIYIRT